MTIFLPLFNEVNSQSCCGVTLSRPLFYICQLWLFAYWGINVTLWFALHTTKDIVFSETFVDFRFVQTFKSWCFSYPNEETQHRTYWFLDRILTILAIQICMTNSVLFLSWNLQHSSWEVSWFLYRFHPVMLCSEANYWMDSYTIKTWRNHCSNIFSSFLLLLIDLIQNYLKQYPHLYSYRHLLTETAGKRCICPQNDSKLLEELRSWNLPTNNVT